MKEECLICKAPLEYLQEDKLMECVICHKQKQSKTQCVQGHYVCDECHTRGMDQILSLCLQEEQTKRKNFGKNDEHGFLSYAWAGASCNGGCGVNHCI